MVKFKCVVCKQIKPQEGRKKFSKIKGSFNGGWICKDCVEKMVKSSVIYQFKGFEDFPTKENTYGSM